MPFTQDESFTIQLSEAQFGDTQHSFVLPEASAMYRAATVTTMPDLHYQLHEPDSPVDEDVSGQSNDANLEQTSTPPARSAFMERLMQVSPLWHFVLNEPSSCVRSLLKFNNYAILTYTSLILHFVMLYLAGFFLFMSFTYDNPDEGYHRTELGVGYEILTVFYAIRSLLLFTMYVIRMRTPSLWRAPVTRAAKAYHHVFHALSLCTAFTCIMGVLLCTVIAPPSDCPSVILHSGVILFFLIRDFISLLVPVVMILWLVRGGHPVNEVALHMPYFVVRSSRSRKPKNSQSMTPEAIKALPCRSFDSQTDEQTTCAICLTDLENGNSMRELVCNHDFHAECLDTWLSKRASCPLCVRVVSASSTASSVEIPQIPLSV